MSRMHFDRGVLADPSWWHWGVTIPLLASSLVGNRWAFWSAALLCTLVGAYYWLRLRQIRPYPVQVRVAYLLWLSAGAIPGMQWMHWIQLLGTTAMATVDYCPLIRLLSLLPFNRAEPFTVSLAWRAFLIEPSAGGLIALHDQAEASPAPCCSLPKRGLGPARPRPN